MRPHAVCLGAALLLAGCRQDMHNQPRVKPFAASSFFADGRSARPPVEGTVPRGSLGMDPRIRTGMAGREVLSEFPLPVTRRLIERGQERFNIFCSPCHARTGEGNGMIVQRGYRQPPSLHTARLRQAPVGHFFDVVTNGFGAMPSYASRVPVEDRWAIIAFVRALQASRQGTIADVPEDRRGSLQGKVK